MTADDRLTENYSNSDWELATMTTPLREAFAHAYT